MQCIRKGSLYTQSIFVYKAYINICSISYFFEIILMAVSLVTPIIIIFEFWPLLIVYALSESKQHREVWLNSFINVIEMVKLWIITQLCNF
jgi:hypothetical protein